MEETVGLPVHELPQSQQPILQQPATLHHEKHKKIYDQTTAHVFHKTLLHTDEWLKGVCDALEIRDLHVGYVVLKAVLHTLRDRMPINECVHFSAQLPLILRGMYFEGWIASDIPVKVKTAAEFLELVACQPGVGTSIPEHISAEQCVRAVTSVLRQHIPEELEKTHKLLHHNIAALFSSGLSGECGRQTH